MAVVSVILPGSRRILDPNLRFSFSSLLRAGTLTRPTCTPQNLGVLCRSMGGGHGPRKMIVSPSRQEWKIFKDQLHFYVMLGFIPLGSVILYSNIIVGPAQLTDIPEGYQPERWEYYRHPIQRWFAKHIYMPPEKNYEINLHHLVREQEKKNFKLLEKRVMSIMKEQGDYKDWYYVRMDDRSQLVGKEFHEEVDENWAMPAKMHPDNK